MEAKTIGFSDSDELGDLEKEAETMDPEENARKMKLLA
jgi:hypothetical protein